MVRKYKGGIWYEVVDEGPQAERPAEPAPETWRVERTENTRRLIEHLPVGWTFAAMVADEGGHYRAIAIDPDTAQRIAADHNELTGVCARYDAACADLIDANADITRVTAERDDARRAAGETAIRLKQTEADLEREVERLRAAPGLVDV